MSLIPRFWVAPFLGSNIRAMAVASFALFLLGVSNVLMFVGRVVANSDGVAVLILADWFPPW